ncbi:MAG: helix-turn-helix transcriptional regulator [Rhizobacter sp.]|nr:helix-turn-helix transcriptional regulator [Chlorobiales bacterium]
MATRKITSTNFQNHQHLETCPVTRSINLIGGRWKTTLLWGLMQGITQYSELRRAIPNITEKMLTQQLRDLQRDGLITKEVHSDAPHKTSYHLTELGRSAKPIMLALQDWGNGLQPVRSEAV